MEVIDTTHLRDTDIPELVSAICEAGFERYAQGNTVTVEGEEGVRVQIDRISAEALVRDTLTVFRLQGMQIYGEAEYARIFADAVLGQAHQMEEPEWEAAKTNGKFRQKAEDIVDYVHGFSKKQVPRAVARIDGNFNRDVEAVERYLERLDKGNYLQRSQITSLHDVAHYRNALKEAIIFEGSALDLADKAQKAHRAARNTLH